MEQIRQDAEAKLAPFLKAEGMDCGDILYSWDNDRIHVGADLATVGIADDMRLELPECSSDMHKVIEHVHGNIQRELMSGCGAIPLASQQWTSARTRCLRSLIMWCLLTQSKGMCTAYTGHVGQ